MHVRAFACRRMCCIPFFQRLFFLLFRCHHACGSWLPVFTRANVPTRARCVLCATFPFHNLQTESYCPYKTSGLPLIFPHEPPAVVTIFLQLKACQTRSSVPSPVACLPFSSCSDASSLSSSSTHYIFSRPVVPLSRCAPLIARPVHNPPHLTDTG
jgi:hypothetical protein